MDKALREEIIGKTKALIDAPSCSREAREAGERWLSAAGTDAEDTETRAQRT